MQGIFFKPDSPGFKMFTRTFIFMHVYINDNDEGTSLTNLEFNCGINLLLELRFLHICVHLHLGSEKCIITCWTQVVGSSGKVKNINMFHTWMHTNNNSPLLDISDRGITCPVTRTSFPITLWANICSSL